MNSRSLFRSTAIALLMATLAFNASAASFVVGLAPNYTAPDRELVLRHLLVFILEGAAPGDDIQVYDALNRQAVARFSIPSAGGLQANARARAVRLAGQIAQLKKFLANAPAQPVRMTGVIHLPEFLDLAGSQLRSPSQALHVILIGSPFYRDAENETFDMAEAFPSDGHLLVDQSTSVFGTALRRNSITGVTVHYAYLRECFLNDYHRERIQRFWTLFVGNAGGGLATFAPGIELALQRARENVQQPALAAQINAADTKVEMRHIMMRRVSISFGATNPIVHLAPVTSGQSPATSTNRNIIIINQTAPVTAASAPEFPIAPLPSRVGIGIMWGARADCDLYVRPAPEAEELFFQKTKTSAGRYFHDYRDSNMGLDFEYVELETGADLRRVTAWVNYYAGQAGPVAGTVVVHHQGRAYRGDFKLEAAKGNSGAEGDRRAQSSSWARLDLLQIVGLTPQSSAAAR